MLCLHLCSQWYSSFIITLGSWPGTALAHAVNLLDCWQSHICSQGQGQGMHHLYLWLYKSKCVRTIWKAFVPSHFCWRVGGTWTSTSQFKTSSDTNRALHIYLSNTKLVPAVELPVPKWSDLEQFWMNLGGEISLKMLVPICAHITTQTEVSLHIIIVHSRITCFFADIFSALSPSYKKVSCSLVRMIHTIQWRKAKNSSQNPKNSEVASVNALETFGLWQQLSFPWKNWGPFSTIPNMIAAINKYNQSLTYVWKHY